MHISFVNAVKWNRIARPSCDHYYFAVNRFEFVPTHDATQPSIRACECARALLLLLFITIHTYKHETCLQAHTLKKGRAIATMKERMRRKGRAPKPLMTSNAM